MIREALLPLRHWRIVTRAVHRDSRLHTGDYALLPDENYRRLQIVLLLRPAAGDLITGSGGLRVIYYWVRPGDHIYMLLPYRKGRKDDLTRDQVRILRKPVEENLK